MKQRVYRIGIELEGGWKPVPEGVQLVHDGSVQLGSLDPIGAHARGEIPSPPLELTAWEDWVRKHYPHICNSSCGLHTHLSFRSALHYQRLMDPEYPKAIIKAVHAWAKDTLPPKHYIWERLKGKNRYCLDQFLADQQARVTQKGHSRYTAVNYCFLLHRTLEVRLLPMFEDIPAEKQTVPTGRVRAHDGMPITRDTIVKPERKGVNLAVAAIQVVLDTTNRFLYDRRWKERLAVGSLALDQHEIVAEEYRLTI